MILTPSLVEGIKRAALDAVENSKPTAIMLGVVESISPLSIRIDQKSVLEANELLLTKNVVDYWCDMTVDHETQRDADLKTEHTHPDTGQGSFDSKHQHGYKGRKTFLVHNGLDSGDSVILIRVQGDQKYVVLDKVMNS